MTPGAGSGTSVSASDLRAAWCRTAYVGQSSRRRSRTVVARRCGSLLLDLQLGTTENLHDARVVVFNHGHNEVLCDDFLDVVVLQHDLYCDTHYLLLSMARLMRLSACLEKFTTLILQ